MPLFMALHHPHRKVYAHINQDGTRPAVAQVRGQVPRDARAQATQRPAAAEAPARAQPTRSLQRESGRRLPTLEIYNLNLNNPLVGCSFDGFYVWSNTPCTTGLTTAQIANHIANRQFATTANDGPDTRAAHHVICAHRHQYAGAGSHSGTWQLDGTITFSSSHHTIADDCSAATSCSSSSCPEAQAVHIVNGVGVLTIQEPSRTLALPHTNHANQNRRHVIMQLVAEPRHKEHPAPLLKKLQAICPKRCPTT